MSSFFFFNTATYSYKFLSEVFSLYHITLAIVFSFLFISKFFLIHLLISSLTQWSFLKCFLNFHVFMNFLDFLLLLISVLSHYGQRRYFVWFQSFKISSNILDEILHFIKRYHWKELWEKYKKSLLFPTAAYQSTIILVNNSNNKTLDQNSEDICYGISSTTS